MQVIGGAYNTAQPQEHIPVEESQSENLTDEFSSSTLQKIKKIPKLSSKQPPPPKRPLKPICKQHWTQFDLISKYLYERDGNN